MAALEAVVARVVQDLDPVGPPGVGRVVAAGLDADRLAAPGPCRGEELAGAAAEIEHAGAGPELGGEEVRPQCRLAGRAVQVVAGRPAAPLATASSNGQGTSRRAIFYITRPISVHD